MGMRNGDRKIGIEAVFEQEVGMSGRREKIKKGMGRKRTKERQ